MDAISNHESARSWACMGEIPEEGESLSAVSTPELVPIEMASGAELDALFLEFNDVSEHDEEPTEAQPTEKESSAPCGASKHSVPEAAPNSRKDEAGKPGFAVALVGARELIEQEGGDAVNWSALESVVEGNGGNVVDEVDM
ncbi:hypothetical protein FGB62_102g027 [Gracilaria domingensis]|nr:hypothetical protein FGB62_102g027 [Gracilaria domingensis]